MENMGEFAPQSQTVVPVTESPQEFQSPESPKCFIDMDSHNDNDISLYDPNIVVKTEKVYVPCSMSSTNNLPNLPNFCSISNEPYVQSVKEEPFDTFSCVTQYGNCDIGSAVVVALKNEISQVCRILGISPGTNIPFLRRLYLNKFPRIRWADSKVIFN
jgi:hypothetical protein